MLFVVIAVGLVLVVAERVWPAQLLPRVPWFWGRALAFNLIQLGIVVVAGLSWDQWLARASLLAIGRYGWPVWLEGFAGYVVTSFVYYWWHRARHDWNWLWLLCHQLHHSPQRIETITSFYKHPIEIFCNSLLSGAISYLLLGLSIDGAGVVTLISGIAEFVYHMNIRTPRRLGWFIQRPEMHRLHHERGKHYNNFGDLPIWDMLFGTYMNPELCDVKCGFRPERERRLWSMLACRNVNDVYVRRSRVRRREGTQV